MTKGGDIKAVLFDFDGTLAKTMEDHFESWKRAMADYGVMIKPNDYYVLEGLRVFELPERFFKMYQTKPRDEGKILQNKEKYYLERHNFELYPGAKELIERLFQKKVPMGVVTAGLSERLAKSTPNGFLGKFNVVVTGRDTKKGKPSPDPYLKGAEQLGVKPEECIVIENAPLGIEAAKKAGTYCIAICSTLGRDYLKQADEIIDSFSDLDHSKKIEQLLTC
jgi:beta-phosphoglucomutase